MIVWTTSKIRVMGICAIGNCVRQGINVTDAAVLNRGLFRTQKIFFHLLMVKCSMMMGQKLFLLEKISQIHDTPKLRFSEILGLVNKSQLP